MARRYRWAFLAWLVLAAAPVWAENAAGVPWSSLSSAEQQLLARPRDQWDPLPPGRQQARERGAQRWRPMTPEERERAKQRFKRWKELSPADGSDNVFIFTHPHVFRPYVGGTLHD